MAGVLARGGGAGAPAGYVWDAKKGAYVTPDSQRREAASVAEASRPLFETDPMGRVHQYQPNADGAGNWQQVGRVGGAFDALDGVARGGAGGGAGTAPNTALISKIDELWNKGPIDVPQAPVFTAPQTPALDPKITPGERAQLTSSKERSGLRLQGAMKALNDQMAGGDYLFGSGKHSSAMSALVQQAFGDMEETERGVLAGRTGRVHELENMGYGGATHAANQNFAGKEAENAQRVQAQIAERSRLAQLLSYYGMAY